MKLSEFARQQGISYKTAWRWWKDGKLPGKQMPSGTVLLTVNRAIDPPAQRAAIYVRVSSAENRANLETQAERVRIYCLARGYQVHMVVKEVGSGANERRPKFLALLADPSIARIVVEHKDRATRFGFGYLEAVLAAQGRAIEAANVAENDTADLVTDLVAMVYSFAARLYGPRRAKRKTMAIQAILERTEHDRESEDQDATGGTASH